MKSSFILTCLTIVTIVILLNVNTIVGQTRNDLIDTNKQQGYQRGRGWMSSAQELVAGPTGQMLVHMAKEMISRSAGNSQVLSLNVTNLFILVLLKALIFGAGLIGAGNWSHYARGRSDESTILDETESPLFVGFLAAQGSGQDGCLQRAACRTPETANEYLKAAKAVLKGAEIFNETLPFDPRYNQLIQTVEQASVEGLEGAPCDMLYSCRV